MRGFNEGNGSGRLTLTERLEVVVDLIIDDGGIIYAAQRGGV